MILTPKVAERWLPYLLLAAFFVVSFVTRPLLPVDETRYLTVSWEMLLRRSFIVPTLNFEPYFQKPPLLFWLIDFAWSIFGVSRAAALAVIFAISSGVIYLSQRLAEALFPDHDGLHRRMPWLMLGSAVFLVYSSLILFDLLQTVFVLAAMLALVAFAGSGRPRYAALAGLFIGFGVLTKGPVMLIHIACPVLLYPLWRNPASDLAACPFFKGMALLLATGFVHVLIWMVPLLYQMGGDFAYSLIWRQAAGRVSGNLESAHARPIYFYLMILPAALLPWIFSTDLWRSKPFLRIRDGVGLPAQDLRLLRFLASWVVVVFVLFSLISGKQPHYLVPVLPPLILLFGYFLAKAPLTHLRYGALIVITVLSVGQAVASFTLFRRFDLEPLGDFIGARRDADWAFVGRYHGEVTFLARLVKPMIILAEDQEEAWLKAHPNGFLIEREANKPDPTERTVYSQRVDRRFWVVVQNP